MKLYGSYTSPFVRHCRIVMLETGLTCDFVVTDMAGSAVKSPTQRVPFLEVGDQLFSDSSSIIKFLREKTNNTFCASVKELDEYCLVNTALEATINLFFLARDGVQVEEVPYLQRQAARIETSVSELNKLMLPMSAPYNDAHLRLACYMGWAKFRNLFDFSSYMHLEDFYAAVQTYENFKITEPKL